MIEMGKKYRTASTYWVAPIIYEVDRAQAYGRVGPYPISWSRESGKVAQLPDHLLARADSLSLVEELPEVTERRAVAISMNTRSLGVIDETGLTCSLFDCGWDRLGAIAITHNGKEIVKVEVVK